MDTSVLEKAYNPKDFEERIYKFWMDNKYFAPNDNKDSYIIVIPPPNVTGILHMGHGLNNSLQDILIRYNRMLGKSALWVPGSDHAGIATQNVVERKLRDRGTSREELGREKFIDETWKVKEEHYSIIKKQLQKIGASCDWDRERFTLDEGLSSAVREVFVNLFEKDLIYKGTYLINWCSSCGTAISDDEVEHEEIKGKLYYYNYPASDGSGLMVQIATTRPETMLGDTAVAVNPDDKRYKNLIGKKLNLPLTGREIPVIADSFVSMEFGTGAVKVTPAHDQNDYEMGMRHNLEKINILNKNGTLSDNVPPKYRNLPVKEARKLVIEDIKEAGLFIKEEDHVHQVGHCYRCHTVVEPFLSSQWFVRMKPLADKALDAWKTGKVNFYPKKWENTYSHWLLNIRDWCISRQLWWGHRIPVWYCGSCGKMTVKREDPDKCQHCGSSDIKQDPDVLDTWFSSWLWPFSTLGWPLKTEDMKQFYPTSTLVTAYDIIFFWVARMIMAGMEFLDTEPFKDIYIHGLVRDKKGRKMSKSLGNGIDPLEIVDEYGADAFKFTLAFLAAQGQDILIDKDTFKIGSKFANKIWNAARFILMNADGREFLKIEEIELKEIDKWILHKLNETVKTVKSALEKYCFNDASQAVYEFFWNDYCDWYIEASKLSLYSDDEKEKDRALTLLVMILEESLRLIHPFLSFITEEIYQKLPNTQPCIITAPYPEVQKEREHNAVMQRFNSVQALIRAVRTLRSEFTIPPNKKIKVSVKADSTESMEVFNSFKDIITLLIGAEDVIISLDIGDRNGSIPVVGSDFEAFLFIKEIVDLPSEIEKLEKEKERILKDCERTEKKLGNDSFISKAPEEIVETEKNKLKDFKSRIEKITSYLAELKNP